ncbi:MAG TPA: Dna2/Cas4 domain-containing protein, partial [Bacteroidales bacterium]|nr:Dna2/Cas4 domain-containing protein [Bacteroidales bacterium]
SPFTFGVAESKPVGNKASPAQPVKTTLPCFPGWRSRMKIGRPGSIHSVSENDHARLQGLFIHAVLSKMQQPDQLDRVVKHLLAKEVYSMLDPNETIGKLRLIVAHPLIQRMFEEAGEQVSEPTIIKPEGGQYRPDRVVISGANVTVYEFKTGRHEPEHSKQLQHYIELLRNMEYISVKGKLLYIGDTVQCVDVD